MRIQERKVRIEKGDYYIFELELNGKYLYSFVLQTRVTVIVKINKLNFFSNLVKLLLFLFCFAITCSI